MRFEASTVSARWRATTISEKNPAQPIFIACACRKGKPYKRQVRFGAENKNVFVAL